MATIAGPGLAETGSQSTRGLIASKSEPEASSSQEATHPSFPTSDTFTDAMGQQAWAGFSISSTYHEVKQFPASTPEVCRPADSAEEALRVLCAGWPSSSGTASGASSQQAACATPDAVHTPHSAWEPTPGESLRRFDQWHARQLEGGSHGQPADARSNEPAAVSSGSAEKLSRATKTMQHTHEKQVLDEPAAATPLRISTGCMQLPGLQHGQAQSPAPSGWEPRGPGDQQNGQDAVTLMAPMPVDPLTPWGEAVPNVEAGTEQMRGAQDHKLMDVQSSPEVHVRQENAAAAANAVPPQTPSTGSPHAHTPFTRSQVLALQPAELTYGARTVGDLLIRLLHAA